MEIAAARPANTDRLYQGIACGIGAGALWGLVFLTPELARAFNPLELTVGRYLAYGVIAAILIIPRWRAVSPLLSWRDWVSLIWLSVTGNTLYYILMSHAVQTGGIAMTSLVIGFLPVLITIIGSRDHGSVPLRALAPSLLLCIGGAICIGWQAIVRQMSGLGDTSLIGLLCAIGALLSWTAFAVGNSRCLARLDKVSVHDWSLLTGLVTGGQALLLTPVALLAEIPRHDAAEWTNFAIVSIAVALLASIVGNALWNRMSRLLPLTLCGQMILFETLFALIYAFAWEQRLPTVLEVMAFVLLIAGVVSCLSAHRQPAADSLAH